MFREGFGQWNDEGKSSSQPVTVLLVRNVRADRLNEFEEWVKGINQVVKGFEGYLGTDLIRPRDHSHPEYVIVLRFDDYEHLRTWMGSKEREEWVKRSEDMTIGEIHVQEAHGFQPWFTLPDHSAASTSPARYKMALQSWHSTRRSLLSARYFHTFFTAGPGLCLCC